MGVLSAIGCEWVIKCTKNNEKPKADAGVQGDRHMVDLTDWIGKSEERREILGQGPAQFMAATLGREDRLTVNSALPPLWHWLYFLEAKPLSALGRDGHPQKGGFLPPVDLPRRMWAGGRFRFHAPLRLGVDTLKRSTVVNVVEKSGRSGALCFVTLRHEILQGGELALSEEHDIVYREDPASDAPTPSLRPAPTTARLSETVHPSPVLLFRYSALTFNGHRIHYDVDYARQTEGYEGLVFQGPLTATLLVDLAMRDAGREADRPPKTFSFRGLAPISGMSAFHIEAEGADDARKLWARRSDGALAMQAEATF